MTFRVLDTAEWPLATIAPYMSDILRLFGKLAKRFPDDVTTESLFNEYLSGSKRLWLVIDEDGALVACAMTRLNEINATGKRIAILMDLAGDDVEAWAEPLGNALETWARHNAADIAAIEGRYGWLPLLKRWGYRPYAVMMRKELS